MSEDPTRGHGFDELARSLAEGSISRRRALKLFAGTAIAALIPSRAMALTCPSGTVKVCDVPRRTDGTCRRGAAETKCVTPGSVAANAIESNPCSCCGGCGGTDQCREPKPRTCFSTPTTTTTAAGTTSTTTTAAGTTSTTTTAAGTTSTTTTAACIRRGDPCVIGVSRCCGNNVCRAGGGGGPVLCRRPLDT
jgi:hypothetical protein